MLKTEPEVTLQTDGIRPTRATHTYTGLTPVDEPLHESLLKLCESKGFDIPSSSRFAQYIKELKNGNRRSPLYPLAFVEAQQLLTVLRHINDPEAWRRGIETAIRQGPVVPLNNNNNTPGPDFLFETYAAARFTYAGHKVLKAEPDFICNFNGFKFSVAAKRIKSPKQFFSRISDARDQIEKSGIKGIIALDISPLQPGYYEERPLEDFEVSQKRLTEFLDQAYEPTLAKIKTRYKSRFVFGVIAFLQGSGSSGHQTAIFQYHAGGRLRDGESMHGSRMYAIVESLNNGPTF